MMKRNPLFPATLFAVTAFSCSCSSTEIGESKDVNQDKIYMRYDIEHEEGDENVRINCSFRFAGMDGTTLVLSESSFVELDGERLKVDSGYGSGAFYRIYKPITGFYGKHMIRFSDINGKKYNNTFSFDTVTLASISVDADRKQDLKLGFQTASHGPNDYFDVRRVDTVGSFRYYINVKDSFIVIPSKDLLAQKGNILEFNCGLKTTWELQQRTSEGGELLISQEFKPIKIKLRP